MIKKIILYIFIGIIGVGILYFCLIKFINNAINDNYSQYGVSDSLQMAIKNKVFRKKVEVVPNQISLDGKLLEFKECWIEEQIKENHILLFFKTRKFLDTYNLCLTFDYPIKPFIKTKYFFVREDLGRGFNFKGLNRENLNLVTDEIDLNGLSNFKVSLIKNWNEKRLKNLEFIIK